MALKDGPETGMMLPMQSSLEGLCLPRLRYGALIALFWLGGCAEPGVARPHGAGGSGGRLDALLLPAQSPADSRLGRYVQEVGQRLMAGARYLRDDPSWPTSVPRPDTATVRDVLFCLVEGPTPNAFTAGEPRVYATSALLKTCRNEDEFAGALAVAYAHLICRHVSPLAITPAETPEGTGLAFASQRPTPTQDRQADELAVALMARAGWAPEAYQALVDKLATPNAEPRVSLIAKRLQALPTSAADWRQPPVADAKRYAANQALPIAAVAGDSASAKRAKLIVAAFHNCFTGDGAPEQLRARADLQPPPPVKPEDNPWGKGLPGGP